MKESKAGPTWRSLFILIAGTALATVSSCAKEEGEPCENKEECVTGLVCQDTRCFKLRQAGAPCEKTKQCIAGLDCLEGKCFKARTEGQRCEKKEQCVVGLMCYKKQCFSPLKAGAPCSERTQCATNLVCYEEKCTPGKSEGAACKDTMQCNPDLECFLGKCSSLAAVKVKKGEAQESKSDIAAIDALCKKARKHNNRVLLSLRQANFEGAEANLRLTGVYQRKAGEAGLALYAKNSMFADVFGLMFWEVLDNTREQLEKLDTAAQKGAKQKSSRKKKQAENRELLESIKKIKKEIKDKGEKDAMKRMIKSSICKYILLVQDKMKEITPQVSKAK